MESDASTLPTAQLADNGDREPFFSYVDAWVVVGHGAALMLDSIEMATDEHVGGIAVAPIGSATEPIGWSNRILTLGVAAILVLTLYPFQFDFSRHLSRPLFPFSLGGWGKSLGPVDDLLNVLLFVPYGFGLAEKLRERGTSRLATLGFTVAAGALLSYTIELLQLYIPIRDSGWEDVFTNSFGALAGAFFFDRCGGTALRLLFATERKVAAWLTWQRAATAIVLYAGLWSAVAVHLQKKSRLTNWEPESFLVIGNSADDHFSSAWKGRVFGLQLWDHSLGPEIGRRLTSSGLPDASSRDSIVAYPFSGPGPFPDERQLLPDLSWTPAVPVSASPSFSLDGRAWLSSARAVPELVRAWSKTGHFSLWVVCEPVEIGGVDAAIVSISSPSGLQEMELRQKGTSLVFWFRTLLSTRRERMSWVIADVFAENEKRDILFTFDGVNLSLFVDGNEYGHTYELGPGAALARLVRRIKMRELMAYKYVFYALVFIPAGCLVGLSWRSWAKHRVVWLCRLLLGLSLPCLLFEVALVGMSGRAVSFENIWLSILLAAAGSIWINADVPDSPQGRQLEERS